MSSTKVSVYVERITKVDVEVEVENSQVAAAVRAAVEAAIGTANQEKPDGDSQRDR